MTGLTLRQLIQFAWDEHKVDYYLDVSEEELDQLVPDYVVDELNWLINNFPR